MCIQICVYISPSVYTYFFFDILRYITLLLFSLPFRIITKAEPPFEHLFSMQEG